MTDSAEGGVVVRRARRLGRLIVWGLLLTLTFFFIGLSLFYLAMGPRLRAEQRLYRLATDYAKLSQVSDFSQFTGEETYYSVIGQDSTGQEVLVVLKDGDQTPRLLQLTDGLSKDELKQLAEERGIIPERFAFGAYRDQLVWEVKSASRYYLFAFETGELVTVLG